MDPRWVFQINPPRCWREKILNWEHSPCDSIFIRNNFLQLQSSESKDLDVHDDKRCVQTTFPFTVAWMQKPIAYLFNMDAKTTCWMSELWLKIRIHVWFRTGSSYQVFSFSHILQRDEWVILSWWKMTID